MDVHWVRASSLILLVFLVHQIVAPPTKAQVNQTHHEGPNQDENEVSPELNLEYKRYLQEVVDALEADPDFRKKLETAKDADFRNGKVAAELEFASHHVRTKLDEIKRTELSRLRDLVRQLDERKREETDLPDLHGHLDHSNPHTFEVSDLQMLMNKVRSDLEEADKLRRQEFKEYELQKEFEKEQKLKSMDEEHKKAYIKELEEKKKHRGNNDIHHPGSKAQLEEVWEKSDHMNQKFNPKAFFYLHDIDGNGYWDEQEVSALFLKELDKFMQDSGTQMDLRERQEEMERMREHVFNETDFNRDRLISYAEFKDYTNQPEFQKDEGWETIDQKPQFTHEEYENFERRRQAEIQKLIDAGVYAENPPGLQYHHAAGHAVPMHPNTYYDHPGGAAPMMPHPAQYAQHPAGAQPPQYQAHPQSGQVPQYQAHPQSGQAPQYQAHPQSGQAPQYQAHPQSGQAPQYQAHPQSGQPPQYQAHPQSGQAPQYQAHPQSGQAPQYQAHPQSGQVPQYQAHPQSGQPVPQNQYHPPPPNQFQNQPPQTAQHNQPPPQAQYQAKNPAQLHPGQQASGAQYAQPAPPAPQYAQPAPPAPQNVQSVPASSSQQAPPAVQAPQQAQPAVPSDNAIPAQVKPNENH